VIPKSPPLSPPFLSPRPAPRVPPFTLLPPPLPPLAPQFQAPNPRGACTQAPNPCPCRPHSATTLLHCYKIHCIFTPARLVIREETMAGAPESSGIVLSLLLLAAAATASPPPFLNSSLPDPAAVVADFHRY
jgi:hypothetical protein